MTPAPVGCAGVCGCWRNSVPEVTVGPQEASPRMLRQMSGAREALPLPWWLGPLESSPPRHVFTGVVWKLEGVEKGRGASRRFEKKPRTP